MHLCPCNSGKPFLNCCDPFISGLKTPTTPEELMRSRYTAYTQANINYIQQTMKAPANINFDPIDAAKWAASITWIKLEVLQSKIKDGIGFVEFKAHFLTNQKPSVMHELSEFHLENDRWYYVDGKDISTGTTVKTGRNDPCHCGSSKKYKKCCGK